METEETLNFREVKQVTMVTVREGKGTSDSISRLVQYFYDGDTFIGEIDPLQR